MPWARRPRVWRVPMGGAIISCRILVFAKAPVPGWVKTRLVPALGEAGAAQLYRQLVERTLDTALSAGLGAIELWCAPDTNDPYFAACAKRYGVRLRAQGQGDLGGRMARALKRTLATGTPGLLIGCDCPVLAPAYLREAAAALAGGSDAVFGPAEDGGYVLVGLARMPPAQLFEDISWGTALVMQETRARLGRLGWRWRELATLWDVDRPEDFLRLRQLHGERNGAASAKETGEGIGVPVTSPARGEEESPAKPAVSRPSGKNFR
jgi:rSAM/selenodomain-associated transferase 1